MSQTRWSSSRTTKIIIVAMIGGAVAFGLLLGYLAFQNQSLPTEMKPFSDFATVVYSTFNGTEYYFKVQWTASGNFTPLAAQITSDTDAANSPVCGLAIDKISQGQSFELPFGTASPETALTNTNLYIAVRDNSNMTQFTIAFHVDQVNAVPGNINTTILPCTEQPSPM